MCFAVFMVLTPRKKCHVVTPYRLEVSDHKIGRRPPLFKSTLPPSVSVFGSAVSFDCIDESIDSCCP